MVGFFKYEKDLFVYVFFYFGLLRQRVVYKTFYFKIQNKGIIFILEYIYKIKRN